MALISVLELRVLEYDARSGFKDGRSARVQRVWTKLKRDSGTNGNVPGNESNVYEMRRNLGDMFLISSKCGEDVPLNPCQGGNK